MTCNSLYILASIATILLIFVLGIWLAKKSRVPRKKAAMADNAAETIYASFLNEAEWKDFSDRNQKFLRLFPNLLKAMDIAFVRNQTGPNIDVVILTLGRLCLEEFMEILLLSGHGYGIAAIRSIRGMYERAVTAEYLHKNPGEVNAFLNYHHIAGYKMLKQIQATMGTDVLSPEQTKRVEESYQEYKAQFMVSDCKKCGTFRVNHNWSKLDFVAMASKTSLGPLIVPDYYLPTRQIHSTIGAVFSRLEVDGAGGLVFKEAAQRGEADDALMAAHGLILSVIELQKNHFKIEALEAPLQTCLADYSTIWKKSPSL